MANGFGFQPQPQSPAVSKQAVGRMLAQRRMAQSPTQQAPGLPVAPGQSSLRGAPPMNGRARLLQSPLGGAGGPGGPSSSSAGFGAIGYGG